MSLVSFELQISYGQFGIFDASMESPFNDWSAAHVAQGFSWRPDSAWFAVPFEDGPYAFEVVSTDGRPSFDETAHRAILVPFPQMTTADLEIASVGSSHMMQSSSDRDSILAEFYSGSRTKVPLIRLTFYNEGSSVFQIIKADSAEMANARILKIARAA